jgi:hypothetical protein
MAESMDDVRGGPRAISTRCGGAVAAMGGRVLVGDVFPPPLEVWRGSETLWWRAFGAFMRFSDLSMFSRYVGAIGNGEADLELVSFAGVTIKVS